MVTALCPLFMFPNGLRAADTPPTFKFSFALYVNHTMILFCLYGYFSFITRHNEREVERPVYFFRQQ